MLVVDSNVVVVACATDEGFTALEGEELVAPPLMWSEAVSAVHEAAHRREIDQDLARLALSRVVRCPVVRRTHGQLAESAWRIADEFGWAKTYDAEYVALASLLSCRLVTVDRRLRRGTERLGFVIGPEEL